MDQSSSKSTLGFPQAQHGLSTNIPLLKSHLPLDPVDHHSSSFNNIHSSPSQPILTSSSASNLADTPHHAHSHQHTTTHSLHSVQADSDDNYSDSGPDYYTSDSDSESEFVYTPRQRAKREKLRGQRDAVKPSYYYGEKELEEEAIKKGINRPKLKRKGLRGVPVFEPPMDQFEDFYSYIDQIERWGSRSGIVKIVPPKEWSDNLPHLGTESLRTDGGGQMLRIARIKSPISQVIQGSRGLFRVMNVAKRKNYNALEWYDLANTAEHRPPDFFNKTGDVLSADYPADQLTDSTSFRSMRSTRSSRRSTSHIAPISNKAPARRRKVSQPTTSVIDATQSTGSPRQVGDGENWSPTKLAPVPENQSSLPEPTDSQSTLIRALPGRANQDSSPKVSVSGPVHEECNDHKTTTPDHSPGQQRPESYHNGTQEPKPAGPLPTDISPPPSTMSVAQATPDQSNATLASASNEQVSEKKHKRSAPAQPTAEEWAQFVARYDQLPYGASKEDYTAEVCKEIEQEYWRTIGNGGEPIYGADTTGSLFDERTKHWNVANLDNLLTRLKLKKKIPGVNTPYLYFGTWRATFAWHVEDADLYSINYIHFGAPKIWYSIPQEHNPRFEDFMSSSFAKERRTCPEFLRHKAFLASPATLQSVGIQLNKVVQLPGEIILTYPYGYHSGFNLGYNCAESVNFANEAWIEKGKKAKFCKCIDDAVTIDVEAWLKEHEELSRKELEVKERALLKAKRLLQKADHQEQKQNKKRPLCEQPGEPPGGKPKKKSKPMNGEAVKPTTGPVKVAVKKAGPTGDLGGATARPSLDESKVAVKKAGPTGYHAGAPVRPSLDQPKVAVKKPGPPGSRQAAGPDGEPKKRKPEPSVKKPSTGGETSAAAGKRARAAPKKKPFPCALCPDMSEDTLLRIVEEPGPSAGEGRPGCTEALDRADAQLGGDADADGSLLAKPPSQASKVAGKAKTTKYAHRLCCMFTPSTWIESLPTGEEVVKGFEGIEKARWALKCQLCKEKMGTKVQCTKSQKCAKACHVTCGLNTGLFFIDAQLVRGSETYSLLDAPPEGGMPEGFDSGQDPQLVVLCKQHNPVYKRAEAMRKSLQLSERMAGLTAGQPIKVRTPKGVFQVFFLSRDEPRQTVRVTFEDGHAGEVAYNKVSFLSEEDCRKVGYGDCGKEGVEGGEKADVVGWKSGVASGVERDGDLAPVTECDASELSVNGVVGNGNEGLTGVGGQADVGNGGVGVSRKMEKGVEGRDACVPTTCLNDHGHGQPALSLVKPGWSGIQSSTTSLKPVEEECQPSTTPVSCPEPARADYAGPPVGPTPLSSSHPVLLRPPPPPPIFVARQEAGRCGAALVTREQQQSVKQCQEERVNAGGRLTENAGVEPVKEATVDNNRLQLLADLSAVDMLYQRYQHGYEDGSHEQVDGSVGGGSGGGGGGCEGGCGGEGSGNNEPRKSKALMAGLIDSRLL